MTISPGVLEVYDRYIALAHLARAEFLGTLAGRLLLVPGFEAKTQPLILAMGIASAATLVIESDARRVQEANLSRVCEFTVNTLDEAIRILKNQIRKREPVAVLLKSDVATSLNEIVERGLQPDLIAFLDGPISKLVTQLVARGARRLDLYGGLGSQRHEEGLIDLTWRIAQAPGLWLPKLDALFENLFPGDPRSQWIGSAPLYLDRQLQFERFVRMTREEAGRFVEALINKVAAGAIGVSVAFKIGEEAERLISAG